MRTIGRCSVALLVITLATFAVVGCYTSSQYVTTTDAQFSNYRYAMLERLKGYGGSASMYDMEVRIFNALEEVGFIMIGEEEASQLDDDTKRSLLGAKFAVSQSAVESVVTVTFYDFVSGRPLGNARGAHGTGMTVAHDLRRATEKAIEQIRRMIAHSP